MSVLLCSVLTVMEVIIPHLVVLWQLQTLPVSQSSGSRSGTQAHRCPESQEFICMSWNKGQCTYPGTCSFRHIHATCRQWHMAKDCPSTPDTSEFSSQVNIAHLRFQLHPASRFHHLLFIFDCVGIHFVAFPLTLYYAYYFLIFHF